MMSMNPTVAVVGPGAIGTTVTAALHEVGRTPRICGRTARERLELHVEEGRIVVPGPVQIDPAQVEAAAPWLTALCGADTAVCVLQNGVEQGSIVAPYLSGARVVPSVVWFP